MPIVYNKDSVYDFPDLSDIGTVVDGRWGCTTGENPCAALETLDAQCQQLNEEFAFRRRNFLGTQAGDFDFTSRLGSDSIRRITD